MNEKSNSHENMHNEKFEKNSDCIVGAGDENDVVFERISDIKYAKIQKRLQWWSLNNVRLVAYFAFFIILVLFSVYYFSVADFFVATLAAVAGLFVVYLILSGADYFGSAHTADEEPESKSIAFKVCGKELYIKIDNEIENLSITAIKDVRMHANCVYFKLKGSVLCPCGITFELNEAHNKSVLKKLARKK